MTGSLDIFLFLSIGLFSLGALGVLMRRNALLVLMAIELMLNAVNLAFVSFARSWASADPGNADAAQVFVLMIMGVAAAEAAIGIAIVVSIFRARASVSVDEPGELHG